MSFHHSTVEGTQVIKWSFGDAERLEGFDKAVQGLGLCGFLEAIRRGGGIGPLMSGSIIKHVETLIFNHISKELGESFSECLKRELQGPLVKEYRFCGGAILHLMRHPGDIIHGDVDLYIVPNDDVEFSKVVGMSAPVCSLVNTDITERSPQNIHDVKISLTHDSPIILDIVFRRECDLCQDIDAYACRSGLYGQGPLKKLDIYDFPSIIKGRIHVIDSITPSRVQKFSSKGLICVPENGH